MTGLLRILVFVLFAYIILKTVKYIISVFSMLKNQKQDEKVQQTTKSDSTIDKKDVIDAQFEEIEEKDQSSSNK